MPGAPVCCSPLTNWLLKVSYLNYSAKCPSCPHFSCLRRVKLSFQNVSCVIYWMTEAQNGQGHFTQTCFVFSLSQITVVRPSARRMGKKIVIRHELGEKGVAWNRASDLLITGYIRSWADNEIVFSMEPPCNLADAQYKKTSVALCSHHPCCTR